MKCCEGSGKEAAKPTSSLAGSPTPLSSHTNFSTSSVPPHSAATLPTQTHTCTFHFSPVLPFPLRTLAGFLWGHAQIQHMGGKLNRRGKSLSTLLLYCTTSKSKPTPSIPALTTPSLPACLLCRTKASGRAGWWLTATLLLQAVPCKRSCGHRGDERVALRPGQDARNSSCWHRTHRVQLLIVKQTDFTNTNSPIKAILFYQVSKTFPHCVLCFASAQHFFFISQ